MTIEELKQAHDHKLPFTFGDPVMARTPLPHKATFFPLGFPVEIQTNDHAVLDAAAESWLGYTHLFARKPIEMRVLVDASDNTPLQGAPVTRAHGHILANIGDSRNYSIIDIAQMYAFITVSRATASDTTSFRYFFLEAAALCLISAVHATGIHAACISLEDRGVLLCGDSGAGKSTLSYACARAGWTYVTDDGSFLVHDRADRMVVGNFRQARFRPSAAELFPDLRGREVMRRAESGKPSIELFTAEQRHIKRSPTARIHHIVFLHRKGVRHEQLAPFPRELARHFMLETGIWLPQLQADRQAHIDAFLRIQPLELRYQHLDWAIDRLTQLVQEGHP